MQIQIPKGTFDILPYGVQEPWRQTALWQSVEEHIRQLCKEYGYQEIRTPIYEKTELFQRGVGETSDIVTKEMFTFEDKGGRSLTLRPEATASTMRSFVENRLANLGTVHKFYYMGPMFRHERPQSGRYRQFHQFGVEAIGSSVPEQDAEVIDLLYQLYHRLGLKNLKVHINSVGDGESRLRFKEALLDYLKPHMAELSEESRERLKKNPLRILDSKDPKDKAIVAQAPSILQSLSESAQKHFQQVCKALDSIPIPYVIDDKIVRGLDYYNHTVFEVITEDLGAQNAVGAGGRYDGLIAQFEGPDLPGVGFATGLERLIQVLLSQNISPSLEPFSSIYFIPLAQEEEARSQCFSLATLCRHHKIAAQVEFHAKKVPAAIQNAIRLGASHCAVIGSEELQKGILQLKNLQNREQQAVSIEKLLPTLKELFHV